MSFNDAFADKGVPMGTSMEVFILFDENNSAAKDIAEKTGNFCAGNGFKVSDSANDYKAGLMKARFLVFVIDNTDDYSNIAISEKWRFFQNELRWKRKPEGDIILLTNPSLNFNRLPFALKDCNFLTYDEIGTLPALMNSIVKETKSESKSNTPAKPEYTKQQKTENEPRKEIKKTDNGCKTDHIFEKTGNVNKIPQKEKVEPVEKFLNKKDDIKPEKKEDKISLIPKKEDKISLIPKKEEKIDPFESFFNKKYDDKTEYEDAEITVDPDYEQQFDWKNVNTREEPDNTPYTYEDSIKENDAFLEELKKKAEQTKRKAAPAAFFFIFFFFIIFIIIMSNI